jgi:hypothetical protein
MLYPLSYRRAGAGIIPRPCRPGSWHGCCIAGRQNALQRRNVMYWGGGIIGLILLILLILLLTGNL